MSKGQQPQYSMGETTQGFTPYSPSSTATNQESFHSNVMSKNEFEAYKDCFNSKFDMLNKRFDEFLISIRREIDEKIGNIKSIITFTCIVLGILIPIVLFLIPFILNTNDRNSINKMQDQINTHNEQLQNHEELLNDTTIIINHTERKSQKVSNP